MQELKKQGAKEVLGVGPRASARIPELQSERRRVDPEGIFAADTVFVPLEDGDRTQALVRLGKKVITVDLNPISRTAVSSHISIVDNIVRVMPALVKSAASLKGSKSLRKIVDEFNNKSNLRQSLEIIRGGA
jgi:4-phosphopantoate--beta-alanine ligase